MSKIEEAQEILKALGLPPAQYNEMAALTLLKRITRAWSLIIFSPRSSFPQ
jgi:hypothetical protein